MAAQQSFFARAERVRAWSVAAVVLVLLACAWLLTPPAAPARPLGLTLALPMQLSSGAAHVAKAQGFFAQRGIEPTIETFLLGKQALDSVMQGRSHLALVGDTPFMLAVLRGRRITTVATVFASRKTMTLVVKGNGPVGSAADLRGKTIATVAGTNAEYFLDRLLLGQGLARDSVTVRDVKADALAEALIGGAVDAATLWHPELGKAERAPGGPLRYFRAEDSFVYRFLLVGATDYVAGNGPAIERLLAGLADANDFIQAEPAQAKAIIGTALQLDAAGMERVFDGPAYDLSLDQSLLLGLDAQARWAMKRGIVAPGPLPDFLAVVSQDALRAVRPGAAKIIH